ncbi:MAG: hypothetical protein QF404_10730 [Planctomycetota bacterium]|jgi:hypothetical protein|nr:hypothetical protein [Planctomycetota bacterium]MDP6940006.1 hypothetical protein [Planctomycetota bacterium]
MRNSIALRRLSVVAFAASAIVATFRSLPLAPREGDGLLIVIPVFVVCFLVVRFAFAKEWRSLRENKDLLVPYGFLTGLGLVLLGLAFLEWLGPSTSFSVLNVGMSFSVFMLLSIALWTAFDAWTTVLIVDQGLGRDPDLSSSFKLAMTKFWRVLLALSISMTVFFLSVGVGISTIAAGGMPIGFAILMGGALLINLGTFVLLPVVVTSGQSAWGAFVEGLALSWARKGRLFKLILLQWGLLGAVTYFSTSFMDGGVHRQNTHFGMNAKWLGGYETDTAFYAKYCETVRIDQVPLFSFVLGAVFMLLVIVIKMRAVSRVRDELVGAEAREH